MSRNLAKKSDTGRIIADSDITDFGDRGFGKATADLSTPLRCAQDDKCFAVVGSGVLLRMHAGDVAELAGGDF
jgi:hypothetical protein